MIDPGPQPPSPPSAGARHAHLVGIAGTGMRALAAVMLARGWTITGSDLDPAAEDAFASCGVPVFHGHRAAHVPATCVRLVYSDAVPADNPERAAARRLGIRTSSYPEMLAEITATHRTVAVAGTHGKSTVTAMAAQILMHSGLDPLVVFGATPRAGALGSRNGRGKFAILEACEYRENFLHLRPEVAVLLNIERDHFDYYRSTDHTLRAFSRFADRLPADGLVIASAECPGAMEVAHGSGRRVTTFGVSRDALWRVAKLEHTRGRYRFDLVRHGRRLVRVSLNVPGRHNVLNALAAAAITQHCGVSALDLAEGLAAFRGLRRRLEPRWTLADITWIDDYAHHPTEVEASLAAVRQMYPGRRICCVFQPHQASRLAALLDELAASLHNADTIAIADVFRAREGPPRIGEPSAADLAARLRDRGADVLLENDPREIATQLVHQLQPGDVLVTMGAGDIANAFDDFHCRIGRNCAVA